MYRSVDLPDSQSALPANGRASVGPTRIDDTPPIEPDTTGNTLQETILYSDHVVAHEFGNALIPDGTGQSSRGLDRPFDPITVDVYYEQAQPTNPANLLDLNQSFVVNDFTDTIPQLTGPAVDTNVSPTDTIVDHNSSHLSTEQQFELPVASLTSPTHECAPSRSTRTTHPANNCGCICQ